MQGFFLSLSKWVTRLIGHTMLGGWAAITKTNKRRMFKSTRIDQYPLSTEGSYLTEDRSRTKFESVWLLGN